MSNQLAPLPGAVGLTDLRVYDWPGPDGLMSGGPHVHLACTEAYCVMEGAGVVQTLAGDGRLRETPLEPGRVVWFTPGVIHRLINSDGRLRILVVMQNAGLPEAGDFVLTFPQDVLADPQAYHRAAAVSADGHVYADSLAAARRRRDLAVEGFEQLRRKVTQQGIDALHEFYRLAVALIQPKLSRWRQVWSNGPLAVTQATAQQLDQLQQSRFDHLLHGGVYSLGPPGQQRKLGMCGTLGVYLPEGVEA